MGSVIKHTVHQPVVIVLLDYAVPYISSDACNYIMFKYMFINLEQYLADNLTCGIFVENV